MSPWRLNRSPMAILEVIISGCLVYISCVGKDSSFLCFILGFFFILTRNDLVYKEFLLCLMGHPPVQRVVFLVQFNKVLSYLLSFDGFQLSKRPKQR